MCVMSVCMCREEHTTWLSILQILRLGEAMSRPDGILMYHPEMLEGELVVMT